MNNYYVESMQTLMYMVITVVVPIIGAVVKHYIETLIDEKTQKIEDEKIRQLASDAAQTVIDSVAMVGQTYTDTLKKENRFDKEAQLFAKNMAMSTAISLITSEARTAVEKLHGAFDVWLDTMVEKAVADAKKEG